MNIVLTVISENVPTDTLIDNMTLWEHLISLSLNSAGAVLCDQTGYGSLIQNVSWRPLCSTKRLWDLCFSIIAWKRHSERSGQSYPILCGSRQSKCQTLFFNVCTYSGLEAKPRSSRYSQLNPWFITVTKRMGQQCCRRHNCALGLTLLGSKLFHKYQ